MAAPTTFTPVALNDDAVRRVARMLWVEYQEHGRKADLASTRSRLHGIASVASDVLGLGMTPWAVMVAVKEAYEAYVASYGELPSPTDIGARTVWRGRLDGFMTTALKEA